MDSQPLIIPCPRLPDKFPDGARIFVVDPMLATGTVIFDFLIALDNELFHIHRDFSFRF